MAKTLSLTAITLVTVIAFLHRAKLAPIWDSVMHCNPFYGRKHLCNASFFADSRILKPCRQGIGIPVKTCLITVWKDASFEFNLSSVAQSAQKLFKLCWDMSKPKTVLRKILKKCSVSLQDKSVKCSALDIWDPNKTLLGKLFKDTTFETKQQFVA